MRISRRAFVAGMGAAVLGLAGCGQSTPKNEDAATTNAATQAPATTSAEPQEAEIGTAVPASTSHGDVEITVEGFVKSPSMTDTLASAGNLSGDKVVGVLKLVVRNNSYHNDQYSMPGYVDLSEAMHVTGEDGVNLNPMNTATDYGEYKGLAGAYVTCPQGQAVRAATLYVVDANLAEVTAYVGDSPIDVPATEE